MSALPLLHVHLYFWFLLRDSGYFWDSVWPYLHIHIFMNILWRKYFPLSVVAEEKGKWRENIGKCNRKLVFKNHCRANMLIKRIVSSTPNIARLSLRNTSICINCQNVYQFWTYIVIFLKINNSRIWSQLRKHNIHFIYGKCIVGTVSLSL